MVNRYLYRCRLGGEGDGPQAPPVRCSSCYFAFHLNHALSLGRISFRAIKEKRDYMGKRKSASWMYMSRLAAEKEWAFMSVLHEHGFPVPKPIDHARHCILMEFIDAYPL